MSAKTYTNRQEREKRVQEYLKEKGFTRSVFPVTGSEDIVTPVNPKILVYFHKSKFLLKDIVVFIGKCDRNLEIVFKISTQDKVQKQVFSVQKGVNEIHNEINVPKDALLEVYLESEEDDFEARNVHFSADLYK